MKAKINNTTCIEKGFSTFNIPRITFNGQGCQINVSASTILALNKSGKNPRVGFEVDGSHLFLMWDKEGFEVIPSKSSSNKYRINNRGMIKMINHHIGYDIRRQSYHLQEFKEGKYELIRTGV